MPNAFTWPSTICAGAVSALVKANLRQFDEGAGAMRQPEPKRRQAVLLEAGHFAEGARVSIGHEHRIVSKAGGAARRPYQRSVDAGFDFFEMIVGPGDTQRGNEMRASLRRRRCAAFPEQTFDPRHRDHEILIGLGPARG